jgi:F-type H+-transporting ATPase subunit b
VRSIPFSLFRKFAVRALLCSALFLFVGAWHGAAQESQTAEHADAEHEHDPDAKWKLINTALFALLVGWFVAKNAPRFFNARSADIQKAIKDATGLKIEADFRYSQADRKMATLENEVSKLREQGKAEMEREHSRLQQQTAQEIARIQQNTQNEIEALRKEASNKIQVRTAQRALEAAEQNLRSRFAQGEPDDLVGDFVHLIEQGKN